MNAETGYDLRRLFKGLGRFRAPTAGDASQERNDTEYEIEMLEDDSAPVLADPVGVTGFVDGIQAQMCVAYREQRPMHLYYVAAGAVGSEGPVSLKEHLALLCAEQDQEWLQNLAAGIPIEVQQNLTPPELARLAMLAIGAERDRLEREVVDDLLELDDDRVIVVDGSLTGRPNDKRLCGVVKTTRTRYLGDESGLFSLKEGWRSPRFKISRGARGEQSDRWSCYVQMVDKERGAWNLGLIRLEANDAELLEPLAARCLLERQGSRSGDLRWDRHLSSVKAVEEFLRARRPKVFQL